MNNQNADQHKKIIGLWLEQNILEIVKESETLPVVTADLPDGVGRANASEIKELKSIDIQGMKLLSINQSHVNATVEMVLEVSVDVYWHEYLASQEVRDFVGESEEEFQSITTYFDAPIKVAIDLEILKEPPMVMSHFLKEIGGGRFSIQYKS
jgi:hypothetical protein